MKTKKSSLSVYVFADLIFGNGLKKCDFTRQNLDGRAKCLAQKMREKTLILINTKNI